MKALGEGRGFGCKSYEDGPQGPRPARITAVVLVRSNKTEPERRNGGSMARIPRVRAACGSREAVFWRNDDFVENFFFC